MSQIVPISNSPNQSFQLKLIVDGVSLTMFANLHYNRMAGYWMLDLYQDPNTPILLSTPLVTGVWPAANLLSQYTYMAIGSLFVLNVTGASDDYPDNTELGNRFALLWDDTPTQ